MKKIIISAFVFIFGLLSYAEDAIQVNPFVVGSSTGSSQAMTISLINSKSVHNIEFELFLPERMKIKSVSRLTSRLPYRVDYEFDEETEEEKEVKKYFHEVTFNTLGEGHYKVVMYNTVNSEKIQPGTGNIIRIVYDNYQDIPEGIYPIEIKNAVFSYSGTEGLYLDNSTSYCKVGSSFDNLKLSGDIPSFVVKELNKDNITCLDMTNVESTGAEVILKNPNALQIVKAGTEYAESVAGKNNVIVKDGNNYTCIDLQVSDGASFSSPVDFSASRASYTRAKGSNTWGSICLPYEVKSNEDVAYYTLSNVSDGMLTVEFQETLPAGTPALFKNLAAGALNAISENVEVSANINDNAATAKLVGSYTYDYKVYDENAYYIKNDAFHKNNNYFYCDAFRAYLQVSGALSNSFSISIDDLTAVNALAGNGNVTIEAIYDTTGQLQGELIPGINIVKFSNGKISKIMIK